MLPGLPPLSMINIVLTIVGFVGGMILWSIVGAHSGVWERQRLNPGGINRFLVRQLTVVAIATALMILLRALLGDTPLAGLFSWLSTIGGMIFFAYLGALALTGWRGSRSQ